MRRARQEDFLRHIYKAKHENSILQVDLRDAKGLGTSTVFFAGPITAICGANGVGKSTVLNAILCALEPGVASQRVSGISKLDGATVSVKLSASGVETVREVSIQDRAIAPSAKQPTVETVWIDAASIGSSLIKLYQETTNREEQLAAIGARILVAEQLKKLSFIVGKNYEHCEFFELESSEYGDIPYFRVQSLGQTYGSESMGLGEFTIFYIYWALDRATPGSIVLIEEPETFLSPHSQGAIVSMLAEYGTRRLLWSVITTHSPTILNKLPINHVRLLSKLRGVVSAVSPETIGSYLAALGVPNAKAGVLLVEDRAAREFTKILLSNKAPHIANVFQVSDANDVSGITQSLKFPKTDKWLKIIGLYDGDQRNKISLKGLKWPFTFLPTNSPPERFLMDCANSHPTDLAQRLFLPDTRVRAALGSFEAADHHDWLEDLHRALGVSYEQLVKAASDLWIALNPLDAEGTVRRLEAKINNLESGKVKALKIKFKHKLRLKGR